MADQYAKSWVSKYDDDWYLSLKLAERGMFDQCVTWAKRAGDTGVIVFRNWSSFASQMGCNVRTARKIIAKMHPINKIVICSESPALSLEIVKYEEYQRVRKHTACKNEADLQQKSPLKRKEKTIPEKKRDDVPSKLGGTEATRYWTNQYQDKIGRPYVFKKVDGILIAQIVEIVGLDEFKRIVDWILTTADRWHSTHRTPKNILNNINDIPALMTRQPAGSGVRSDVSKYDGVTIK
jgi:hypothetical protein